MILEIPEWPKAPVRRRKCHIPGATRLCRCHKRRNGHRLDQRTGPDGATRILCTDIGQLSVLHFYLASNLLESASARRENIPPCAAQ